MAGVVVVAATCTVWVAGATAAAAAVTAAVLVVTLVLTAAALTVVCAEVFTAALMVSGCVDLDEDLVLDLEEPDVSSVVSGVSSFDTDDEPLVWAPPLLLTITPEPTSVLDEVDPEVVPEVDPDVVPVVVPVLPVVPEPPVGSMVRVVPVELVVPAPVVPGVVAPAAPELSPDDVDELDVPDPLDELDDDVEPVDAPVVSATATPWPVATAVTNHAATARPP